MTKEEWVELFQAMNGRDPSPQEFMSAKQAGEFNTTPATPTPTKQEQPLVTPTTPISSPTETSELPASEQATVTPTPPPAPVQKENIASNLGKDITEKIEVYAQIAEEKLSSGVQATAEHIKSGTSAAMAYVNDYQNQQSQTTATAYDTGSYFDGGIIEYLIFSIGVGALITLTLGLATPWAVCFWYRWETQHTVIEGRRLGFNGTACQLFGNWIKWFLLTLITFGIYGFWLRIKLKQWITKHTYFVN